MPTKTVAKPDLSITSHATQADAQLLVALNAGPMALRIMDGHELLMGYDQPPSWKQFDKVHKPGSPGRLAVQAVLYYYETIGTFVKQGLLDRGLVYDLLWVKGIWKLCEPIALEYRRRSGEAEMYANFERLAKAQP
jgi:hypothetical protein